MVYQPNVPQPTDFLSRSQKDFLGNFGSMYQFYNLDHTNLDLPEEEPTWGMHKQFTLQEQSSDPTTLATEAALYTKDVGNGLDLYMRTQSDGTVVQITSVANNGPGGSGINLIPKPVVACSWNVNDDNSITLTGTQINVASVTRIVSGQFRITFDTALASDEYYPFVQYIYPQTTPFAQPSIGPQTTTTMDVFKNTNYNLIRQWYVMIWI